MSFDKPLKWDTKLCVQTFCLPFFLKQKKKKNGHFLPVGNKVYLLFLLLEGN